jgi:hypothetical protein
MPGEKCNRGWPRAQQFAIAPRALFTMALGKKRATATGVSNSQFNKLPVNHRCAMLRDASADRSRNKLSILEIFYKYFCRNSSNEIEPDKSPICNSPLSTLKKKAAILIRVKSSLLLPSDFWSEYVFSTWESKLAEISKK